MGWDGTLTASSAEGSEITHTPSGVSLAQYEIVPFTAPKGGIYRFTLSGSGGNKHGGSEPGGSYSSGGTGGKTVGYLLMKEGETVYVGAGGARCAAFVAKKTAAGIDAIGRENMLLMAGGAGSGGANWGETYNMKSGTGGNGGGESGTAGTWYAEPGGQSGTRGMAGGGGGYSNDGVSWWGGQGGDGYYSGSGGGAGAGGAGGSGYIGAGSVTLNGVTYTNSTTVGAGAAPNVNGLARVAFVARDVLPVTFNGVRLTDLIYNGVKVTSLIFNGTKLFARRMFGEVERCLA